MRDPSMTADPTEIIESVAVAETYCDSVGWIEHHGPIFRLALAATHRRPGELQERHLAARLLLPRDALVALSLAITAALAALDDGPARRSAEAAALN